MPQQKLKGRSARVVVTMGMPAFVYRVVYREHALKALEHDVDGLICVNDRAGGHAGTRTAQARSPSRSRTGSGSTPIRSSPGS